jgi:signal transduction histidine kinase
MKEEQVIERLVSVLRDEPNNYSLILELSSKLASFDKNHVRFSVDAGVIDRLGKELVARQETAVSELVKNAYDSDASVVELLFQDTNNIGGELTVEDDGHGMTKEQVLNGFMRISSTDKIHNPTSPIYKRNRAGKKGIGRFATQRLGERLTIITQTAGEKNALKIEINWNDFNLDKDIMSISSLVTEIPKQKEQGTTLIINGLREWWSVTSIKRVYRYSLDIIQPFPLSKVTKDKSIDPGFAIKCYRSINDDLEEIADEDIMFYEHSLSEIEGYIDSTGIASWKLTSKKLDLSDSGSTPKNRKDPESKYDYLRNIHFKAYYFIYNIGMIPKMVEGYIREKANEVGGIRIYRNGFRVLPYGEPQNDWLGLDESVRRRTILPQHGNNNFFGFVEIIGYDTTLFNELSSREGLFKNEAYNELTDFVFRTLLSAVLRIADYRDVKKTTGQKNWVKQEKNPAETVKEIAETLESFANDIDSKNEQHKKDSKEPSSDEDAGKSQKFRELSEQLRTAVDSLEEIGMLRVLAGLGLTIGEFTHEIKQYLPAFDVDTMFLVDNLLETTETYKRSLRLQDSFNSFKTYASYFDETISKNVQRNLHPIELRDAVNSFKRVIEPDLDRNGFVLDTNFSGYDLFTCKMHPSEWASILFNLYSNSKKAIKRAKTPGNIYINAGEIGDNIFMEFSDNGDGIPEENQNKIFNAFFTTSSQKGHSASKEDELTGTGLGLKIIKDIIEGYGGEIFLIQSPEKYNTTFRIELAKATNKEIEEYDV